MAGRPSHGGGGPFRQLLDIIATGVAIAMLMVILVASGGLNAVAAAMGLPASSTDPMALMGTGGTVDGTKPHLLDWLNRKPATQSTPPSTTPQPGRSAPSSTTPQPGRSTGTPAHRAVEDGTYPAAADVSYDPQKALDQAKALKTATPNPAGYDRLKDFGTWRNDPGLCGQGTTRDLILARDLTGVHSNQSCQVTDGTFTDPYTGQAMSFTRGVNTSGLVQIDHVVALSDAYASGARDWTMERREAYANDPDVLLASNGEANMAKGSGVNLTAPGRADDRWKASTPSVWLPDNADYRCAYLAKRVAIKTKYALTASMWEKTETVDYLTRCAAG